jgi:hypothetical protein
MPKKDFFIYLNEVVRIFIFLNPDKKKVKKFVVKLEFYYLNTWVELQRYDTYHGMVHKDIFNKSGEKIKVLKYPLADNEAGLNTAIKDFKENFEAYIWRFLYAD